MYCDWGHEADEVRRLPTGGNSAVFLCRQHFNKELQWRRERNKELDYGVQFDIVSWHSLELQEL